MVSSTQISRPNSTYTKYNHWACPRQRGNLYYSTPRAGCEQTPIPEVPNPESKPLSYPFEPAPKTLTFESMVGKLRLIMQGFPDKRTGSNIGYRMEDVGMGAFAVFFTQSPSFLQFQRDMDKQLGNSNAQSLLQMGEIPCDNHIRDLLDEVPPTEVLPMFGYLFEGLKASGHLAAYRSIRGPAGGPGWDGASLVQEDSLRPM